jgi:hypothetical protein
MINRFNTCAVKPALFFVRVSTSPSYLNIKMKQYILGLALLIVHLHDWVEFDSWRRSPDPQSAQAS